jgi:hypothetical protein
MTTATASPATTLHDVVVTNEQTRAEWRAGRASIDRGRIVVFAKHPPAEILDRPASTYTILAVDGGDRVRRFPSVALDRQATEPGKRYVFA